MNDRDELKSQLTKCILYKKNVGRDLARAEYEYKMIRTKQMYSVIIKGYQEGEDPSSKPIAMTAASEFVQGIPEVAAKRLERDLRKADHEVNDQKIYQVKLELKIVEGDIEAIRRNV